ncbi:DinB family protein [Caldibacillus debilis]|uniref:DinB family protein n=1 Tax=Caldibacillus debilis TaxID=301148 RepID=UPI0023F3303E|nr:DinB family protein [Caldibacillus debilis]
MIEYSPLSLLKELRKFGWKEESWFLPLASAIEGVTAAEAAWRPDGHTNSIWQILNHLNYYNERVLEQLQGKEPAPQSITNTETFGPPGDPADRKGWEETLRRTRQIAQGIEEALEKFYGKDLEKEGFLEKLAAWIMHDTYHTGQIVLLRKMRGTWPAQRE